MVAFQLYPTVLQALRITTAHSPTREEIGAPYSALGLRDHLKRYAVQSPRL